MKSKRPRGVFWVVSTHVTTTCLALLLLWFFLAIGVNIFAPLFHRFPVLAGATFIVVQTAGCIYVTYFSFDYLRHVAFVLDPPACIVPSIATLSTLVALALTGMLGVQGFDPLPSVALLCDFAWVTAVFGWITRREFLKIAREQHQFRGFEVVPLRTASDATEVKK